MRDVEAKISPLISGLFPSFYQEEGPNFIAFVKAYYEWLEQNFQSIDLESVVGFNVGDTITQDNVTGTIYAVVDSSVLVLVNGLETFKCLNVCSEIIPITSSSGASTIILKGGTTRRMGALFLSRNLLNIRDIDRTIDLFVVRFKEKYLKNIEFDTQTNKRLLVKNSLDLYRSKGTSRSIDLFFRLIYGIQSTVYYPGDDLFRLSDAEWFKPQYIEINSSSTERAIALVGKQVTGVDSGATAFVERYVKKKIKNDFVHVLYVSSVKGSYIVGERVKYQEIFDDSPVIAGSLNEVTVDGGSDSFSVGDIISISGRLGDKAAGRVTAVVRGDGRVSFELTTPGWGYTINTANTTTIDSANSFLSKKIITLANVESGQYITGASIVNPGSGYNNTDIITISSRYENAKFRPTTNNSGSVTSLVLLDRGNGYFPETVAPFVETPLSGGLNLTLNYTYDYPKQYLHYLEEFVQPLFVIGYNNEQLIEQFTPGDIVTINEGSLGGIIDVNTSENKMTITSYDKHPFFVGDQIARTANVNSSVIITTITPIPVTGLVINTSPTAIMSLGPPTGILAVGDVVYQTDTDNNIIARGTLTRVSGLTLAGGTVDVNGVTGVFRPNENLLVDGKPITVNLNNLSLKVAVVETSNTFSDVATPFVYTSTSGLKGYSIATTSGTGAQYKIASIENTDNVFVNSDRLNNTSILDTRLNAVAYNLPAVGSANLSSIIFGALSFVDLTIGSIATLGEINPGTGYTADPVASVFQPNITGYQGHDYIMITNEQNARYVVGEYVTQPIVTNIVLIQVVNASTYRKGEKIYAANTSTAFIANGVIRTIDLSSNTLIIDTLVGTVPSSSAYTMKSLISSANSQIVSAVGQTINSEARGRIKARVDNTLYVERLQLNNRFISGQPLLGASTGSNATLTAVTLDPASSVAGLNAEVTADAAIGEGVASGVQIVDSGFGFPDDNGLTFISADGIKTGTLSARLGGVGRGAGYYRNTRGFVSDLSKVHDGDYYQEYSYEIISRLPLDKYSDMFKTVMHTAGTRFFGSVLIDSLGDIGVSAASNTTSSIEIAVNSPYVVEDRQDIDVMDRGSFFIEIREF